MAIEATYYWSHNTYGVYATDEEVSIFLKLLSEDRKLKRHSSERVEDGKFLINNYIFGYEEILFSVLTVKGLGFEVYCPNRKVMENFLQKFAKRIGKDIIFKEKI